MAITYTTHNADQVQSVGITALNVATKADFVLIDSKVDGDNKEATYQLAAGDPDYPLSLRVGHYVNRSANNGAGQTNISVKLSTSVSKLDGTETLWTSPASVVIATTMPGTSGVPDATDYASLLGLAFSWIIPVIAGSISEAALDELQFGVVNQLLDHENSAS